MSESSYIITIGLLLTVFPFGQIGNNCNFDNYINNPNTPQLAKDIYKDKEWNLNNGREALALLDSLTEGDKSSRPFYFKVITKTYEKSDGYFSEGLGLYGKSYVEENTKEFLSYFASKKCFSEKDLQTWVHIVMLEIGRIDKDQYKPSIMDDYIKLLNMNCTDCSPEEKSILDKFSEGLIKEWDEFSKHIGN